MLGDSEMTGSNVCAEEARSFLQAGARHHLVSARILIWMT
jgi:hypothetical protein